MRALLLILLSSAASAQTPKNVVVILADDMGLASLHAEHPGSGLPTANLDRLRSEGMSFTDAHSPSAVCSPTRYALLTGRYSWRTRMKLGIVGKWQGPLIAEDRMTIADLKALAKDVTQRDLPIWLVLWPNDWQAAQTGAVDMDKWAKPLSTLPMAGHALTERRCWGHVDAWHPSEAGYRAIKFGFNGHQMIGNKEASRLPVG